MEISTDPTIATPSQQISTLRVTRAWPLRPLTCALASFLDVTCVKRRLRGAPKAGGFAIGHRAIAQKTFKCSGIFLDFLQFCPETNRNQWTMFAMQHIFKKIHDHLSRLGYQFWSPELNTFASFPRPAQIFCTIWLFNIAMENPL